MPFPQSDRVKFNKNPLEEVICQLRFPPILPIEAKVPADFQERVRARYPVYSTTDPRSVVPPSLSEILLQLQAPMGVQLMSGVSHQFATEDANRLISLTKDFIAVTEKRYETWRVFRAEVEHAKSALEEEYHPTFYSRVGLRYRDVINREQLGLADVPWGELINSQLVGMLAIADVRDEVLSTRGETQVRLSEIDGGQLRVRYGLIRRDQRRVDLFQIDADFFTEGRISNDRAFEFLDTFNRVAGNFFRWAIQPRLRDALEPVELRE